MSAASGLIIGVVIIVALVAAIAGMASAIRDMEKKLKEYDDEN